MRQWLVDIRTEKGYSQKAVCDYAGISQPTYWEYEHGETTPTPPVAKKIGQFLGFNWTRFYDDAQEVSDAG